MIKTIRHKSKVMAIKMAVLWGAQKKIVVNVQISRIERVRGIIARRKRVSS